MGIAARRAAVCCSSIALIAAGGSCREPTQVTVDFRTRTKCSEIATAQIFVGAGVEAAERHFNPEQVPSATTNACDATGSLGTLVITPSGDRAAIVVAVGVSVGGQPPPDSTKCNEPETAKRCIVARRNVAFVDHKGLTLPIDLDPICIGTTCDPAATCFKGGCVPSDVVCGDDSCDLSVVVGHDAGSDDGGYDVNPISDGSFEDAPTTDDGSTPVDASADADSGFDAGGGPYPNCQMGGGGASSFICYSMAGTIDTQHQCNGQPPFSFNQACCRCTCPNGTVQACGLSTSMNGSCNPSCL